MKRISLFLLTLLIAFAGFSQDITGKWNGMLKVQGVQLRLVFNITKTDAGYTSTMDSPDQGAVGIPVTSTVFESPNLTLKIDAAMIVYSAELKDGKFTGMFKQGGLTADLDLSREELAAPVTKRKQDPVKPYPYESEDVTFNNGPDVRLAGTLTLPGKSGKYPAVILISGSGPQNRDEELMGHKPFLVLSDYLTRQGIAVLRYDDRGTAASTGNFRNATTADLATDAEAALAYLKTRKEIDATKIGLCGHSEGGIIAPLVASRSTDVAFIVMMAGTGMPGLELLPLQSALIAKASGASETDLQRSEKINKKLFGLVASTPNEEELRTRLNAYLTEVIDEMPSMDKPKELSDAEFISMLVNQIANPWMMYFLNYDPIPALKKVTCPVLAVNGTLDLQVPYKENLGPIRKALKKNKAVTIVEFPGMNHLFQECTTGAPSEYAQIEETLSEKMLKVLGDWVIGVTR